MKKLVNKKTHSKKDNINNLHYSRAFEGTLKHKCDTCKNNCEQLKTVTIINCAIYEEGKKVKLIRAVKNDT